MFGLGIWELLIILGIVLLIFGGSRLPQLGKALGDTVKEVKAIPKAGVVESEKRENQKASEPAESFVEKNVPGVKEINQIKSTAGTLKKLGRLTKLGRF